MGGKIGALSWDLFLTMEEQEALSIKEAGLVGQAGCGLCNRQEGNFRLSVCLPWVGKLGDQAGYSIQESRQYV